MREELKELNEMSDSRELLESKPNPIMPLFIYLIITILVISFIWTYFGEIDEVVKANGVVRTNEPVSTVRNQVSNQVESIHFSEGQYVEEGDTLFTLDQSDKELQKALIEKDLDEAEEKLVDLETLKKSIQQEENLFSVDNEVYERYKSYQSNLSLMRQEFEGSTLEVSQSIQEQNRQTESLKSQRENINKKIDQLERLKDVIQNKENTFGKEETPYYNQAVEILITIERMEKEIKERKEFYEKAKNEFKNNEKDVETTVEDGVEDIIGEGTVTQEQVSEGKRLYEEAEYELEQYINQQLLQVNNEVDQEKDQLEEIITALNSTLDFSKLENNQKESYQASLENFKSDILVQINNDIESLKQQTAQFKQEISTVEQQMKDNIIKAPIDGIINVRTKLSTGDFLQAGTEVLTIIPGTDTSTYKVQLLVLNQDIANTRVGDLVNFRLHSLPYQEFGQLHGEITKVSADAVHDAETGVSYYSVEATIDNETLLSHKQQEAEIKIGMTTDAHIIVESKKILHFLLEKIDLRD